MEPIPVLVAILCITITVSAASPPLTRNDAHNIYNCPSPALATVVLANEPVYVSGGFLQIKTHVYKFPKQGINTVLINCISIQDKANDGTGGYPKIVAGGIGDYFIEIEFTSQRSHSIDFNVEIFGY